MIEVGQYLRYWPDDSARPYYVRVVKIFYPFNSRFLHAIVNSEELLLKTGYGFFEFGFGSAFELSLRPIPADEAHPHLSMFPKEAPFDRSLEERSSMPSGHLI